MTLIPGTLIVWKEREVGETAVATRRLIGIRFLSHTFVLSFNHGRPL